MKNYDVIIAGGGTAGVPAAIAAARGGAKTLVIEQFGHLGGLEGNRMKQGAVKKAVGE